MSVISEDKVGTFWDTVYTCIFVLCFLQVTTVYNLGNDSNEFVFNNLLLHCAVAMACLWRPEIRLQITMLQICIKAYYYHYLALLLSSVLCEACLQREGFKMSIFSLRKC